MMDYKQQILDILDASGSGAYTTRQIAMKVTPMFGSNMHQHSASVRSWIIDLERDGFVQKLDDQKPVCWLKRKVSK